MKSLIKIMPLVVVVVVVTGCATVPKITADYGRNGNFSAYRNCGFYQPLGTDQAGYESLITQTLKATARQEMEARGYVYAETGTDLLINFNAKLAQQTRVSQTPGPMPTCTTDTGAVSTVAGAVIGLVFTSRHYTRLVRSYGLSQEFIAPHCPQKNGMEERVIWTLKEQYVHRHLFES